MANKSLTSRVENDRVLVLEREFDAPNFLVFKMYKEPEHLKHWWGPRGWDLPVCKIDFKVGGVWLYCMKCVDKSQGHFYGMEAWGKAIYKEIGEPSQLVYRDFFCDAEGTANPNLPSAEVKVEFIDINGKTKLVSRGEYASPEALKTVMDMGMLEGIGQSWDRLEERLKSIKVS